MEIEHVAMLARVELQEESKKLFLTQIGDIIQYIHKLNELDTAGIEPTAHILSVKNVFREDKPERSLPGHEALRNAPDNSAGFYRVPRIIEQ